jgi:Tautomerase enzyme
MPYITVSTVRGILDIGQKQALLERITDLMVEIEGQGNPEFRKSVGQDRGGRARELEPRRHEADRGNDRDDFWTDRPRRKADGKDVAGERRIKHSAFARLAVAEAVGELIAVWLRRHRM